MSSIARRLSLTGVKSTTACYTLLHQATRDGRMTAIIVIIFWDSLMFNQFFVLPQMKRCVVNTSKHGLYELLHELSKELRLKILRNQVISEKCISFITWEPSAHCPSRNENFVNIIKIVPKNRNQIISELCYLT